MKGLSSWLKKCYLSWNRFAGIIDNSCKPEPPLDPILGSDADTSRSMKQI